MTIRCPYCGAAASDACILRDGDDGLCPWDDADETDPDLLREDRDERRRLEHEDS